MPRSRRKVQQDDYDFDSEEDLYADPDEFVEGLRYAVARARCSANDVFELGAGRGFVDLDGLAAADYGD